MVVANRVNFRGDLAAASLKQAIDEAATVAPSHFRGDLAAASLKPVRN